MGKLDFIGIVNHTNTMGSPTVVIEPSAFVEQVRKLSTEDTKWVVAVINDEGTLETFLGAFSDAKSTLEAIKKSNEDWLYLIQSGPYMLEGESVYNDKFWVGVHNSRSQFISSFELKAKTEEGLVTFANQCKQQFGNRTVTLSVVVNGFVWTVCAFSDEHTEDHLYMPSKWGVSDTDSLNVVEEWADEIQTLLEQLGFKVKRLDNPDRG